MRKFLKSIVDSFKGPPDYEGDIDKNDGYIDIEPSGEDKGKIVVHPFVLEEFDDVKQVLDSLREGYTIAIVNIRPLKDKDLVELKRAVNKLKKTTDAIEGEIAGFGEDYLIITPSFASIHKSKQMKDVKEESE